MQVCAHVWPHCSESRHVLGDVRVTPASAAKAIGAGLGRVAFDSLRWSKPESNARDSTLFKGFVQLDQGYSGAPGGSGDTRKDLGENIER
eukprot:1192699-Rhodomonas_salina.1